MSSRASASSYGDETSAADVANAHARHAARLAEVEELLNADDLLLSELRELTAERKKLRTFLWLARGGDRSGEPRPE